MSILDIIWQSGSTALADSCNGHQTATLKKNLLAYGVHISVMNAGMPLKRVFIDKITGFVDDVNGEKTAKILSFPAHYVDRNSSYSPFFDIQAYT